MHKNLRRICTKPVKLATRPPLSKAQQPCRASTLPPGISLPSEVSNTATTVSLPSLMMGIHVD